MQSKIKRDVLKNSGYKNELKTYTLGGGRSYSYSQSKTVIMQQITAAVLCVYT